MHKKGSICFISLFSPIKYYITRYNSPFSVLQSDNQSVLVVTAFTKQDEGNYTIACTNPAGTSTATVQLLIQKPTGNPLFVFKCSVYPACVVWCSHYSIRVRVRVYCYVYYLIIVRCRRIVREPCGFILLAEYRG